MYPNVHEFSIWFSAQVVNVLLDLPSIYERLFYPRNIAGVRYLFHQVPVPCVKPTLLPFDLFSLVMHGIGEIRHNTLSGNTTRRYIDESTTLEKIINRR